MCQHPHSHSHPRNHVTQATPTSRRDFLRTLTGSVLAGAGVMELAWHRAAWASAATPGEGAKLFDIHKAAEGVYFAQARPRAMVNCNAAIFVRSKDVVVVDSHSLPSSAAALLAQIKREVTAKPVRYLINTHFHGDHTQGNHAYKLTGHPVDIISTNETKKILEDQAVSRLKESLDAIPQQIEQMTKRAEKSSSSAEKAFCADQIRQFREYQNEMKNFTLDLPTITFDKSYMLKDAAFDLHLDFHGRAHTSGDLFVYCPQQGALATGDASHCFMPNFGDGFPRLWAGTVDQAAQTDFKYFLGGHGPMQIGKGIMMSQRNFIEEMTERVDAAKKAGQSMDEMKQRITVASLKSLQANGYADFLIRAMTAGTPNFGPPPPLQEGVDDCTRDVYNNLERT